MEINDSLAAEFVDLCGQHAFRKAWFARDTIKRALQVTALVGSILVVINQGDLLLAGMIPPIWKLALTYFVPYCVASYSAAAFKVGLARRGFCPVCQEKLDIEGEA